jgi:hypothetical protein
VNANSKSADQPSQTRSLPEGAWGGDHIALEVTDSGASLEYDCAHGSITEKMVLDGEGKFEVKGFHIREGGPTRIDAESKGRPAIYVGSSDGKTLKLTVKLADTDEVIGSFDLTHGKPGRIRKCK